MSDAWIEQNNFKRLREAVGNDVANDIIASTYERILAEVASDGSIVYKHVSKTGFLSKGGGTLDKFTP